MKAWIALTVIAALLTASCGERTPSTPESPAQGATPAARAAANAEKAAPGVAVPDEVVELPDSPANAAVLAKWTGDFDGMLERRVIRVLTTYSRTMFFVDQGTPRGLVPDSFKVFEDDLNKRLKRKNIRVHVVYVPVSHEDLIPALIEGRGDVVAAGKVVTAWRAEKVDFTKPTRSGISTIVVTGPGVPHVTTVQDLAGKEVYVRPSDVSASAVERFNSELAAAGKPPVRIRPAPEVLADEDLIEMVSAGLVPMTLVDDYIGAFWRQVFPEIVLNKGAAVRTDAQTAMMVRKGSPRLLKELNAFIDRYPEGSLQRNLLLQKYLKSLKYAKPATSAEDIARFRQVVDFMREYGDEYDIDYLLMAAQGYQESGLDHNRKSAVGAIGVMQVMPKTGADMKVGDIRRLEPNIHAGIKYMRFMIDHYYADEPMDDLNKALFSFASYNAGPARIRQLRAQAAKRGLDPNKWFNNVEVVAAESIGRETVQYVSNIYKYYLAYQMAVEQAQRRNEARQAG